MTQKVDPIENFNEMIETYRLSLLNSMGYRRCDIEKPLIGIIHAFNQVSPGNANSARLVEAAKIGIASCDGTPVEIPIPGVCGSMSGGADTFRYNFPYRDCAAALAELMMSINRLDACMFIPTCDNVVPAYLIAAVRVNIPAVFVTGGYMMPGSHCGRTITAFDLPKIISKNAAHHELRQQEIDHIIASACPTPGACPEIGTANTMAAMTEALGMSLPGNATVANYAAELPRMVKDAAEVLMRAYHKNIRPRDVITKAGLEDAAKIVLAIGGSPNVLLHILALADEAKTGMTLDDWDRLSRSTPLLCRIKPNHPQNTMVEFGAAGGVYQLMSVMEPLLCTERRMVMGNTLGEALTAWKLFAPPREENGVIAPLDAPVSPNGGMMVLYGNLAPEGSIIKTSAMLKPIDWFEGTARVFDSEADAARALFAGEVEKETVLVVRYEGPKGAPGAREAMMLMHAIVGMGLIEDVAVVTDGRFSGTNLGMAVGHVSPEAPNGGPIALVQNGDKILIDLQNRRLDVLVSAQTLETRRAAWAKPAPKATDGLLYEWAMRGGSLSHGGILGKYYE